MTKGQIEDVIAKSVTKFYFKLLGVGPRETRVYLLRDMIIIRLKGKLLPIEEHLLKSSQGVELVKDIRKFLHESTVKGVSELIKSTTGHSVISSHSDISTKSGEIFQVYILDKDYESEIPNSSG
ncbi:hypothetical protein A2866_04755 [Candidatus Roizmanbacteria bacterium RIFCSPHIGHO2_01_FULL_39_8]|uniref:Na+-translocating membrane potential-generating system MpsC domain-containing protein n=3 Tax=Candidatus Roizmaniibacteriota TaxID=1752723 RepID=A0A1F7GGW1_9BACT|nr:MAG: hypothetical protein A2866_04755 [Candidatus Roizmanbacteria bacterium RIFCSPHIGHO2_01_FULL_39_8]OGK28510.1 MAG: hypothetical protein A3C28_01935 [Candidatus Roizmanbacteria bacterium RIFCSPHIGHO2_02_FULL_39_9]OGK38183.1 MAG: hypothetical protein A3F60_03055 [Candidatus Roizmanbacteria bacterium RIFCSPHIGHO2_12_FULL_39_8]